MIDLGDFTPEVFTLFFSIAGRNYEFSYEEAKVDEVFQLIAEKQTDNSEEMMERRREIVYVFLSRHIKQGEPEQFKEDLDTVPYFSTKDGLDIDTIYNSLLSRVKKNPMSGEK